MKEFTSGETKRLFVKKVMEKEPISTTWEPLRLTILQVQPRKTISEFFNPFVMLL